MILPAKGPTRPIQRLPVLGTVPPCPPPEPPLLFVVNVTHAPSELRGQPIYFGLQLGMLSGDSAVTFPLRAAHASGTIFSREAP